MSSEAVLRWMNDLSAQGIFMTDAELTISGWNHWLEINSGRSASEVIGQNLFDVYPELVERGLNKFFEAVLTGQVCLLSHRLHRYLLPIPPQLGDMSFAFMQQSARIAPLLDKEQVIGTITIIDDVTERVAYEAELIQLVDRERAARLEAETANRAKDEFLATVSHELRTPLNSIAGWAQILRTQDIDKEAFTHGLDIIERSVKTQTRIIEDILDVSRIITGKLNLKIREVELAPLLEAAVEVVRLAADAKAIRLQVAFDSKSLAVSGDPNRLQQIVWNLLSNAIKFTPQGGTVSVQLVRVDSDAEISVKDDGKGIHTEFLPFVFDRFRQADSTSARQYGGLGLGLAIVRHLVEIHGGTVSAISPGEGKGATFTVRLPLLPAHNLEPVSPSSSKKLSTAERENPFVSQSDSSTNDSLGLKGHRVLIVDDEKDARDMLEIMLTQFGGEIRVSHSAQDALKVLEQWHPHVLISDIGMPEEDGYFLIRQIRALEFARGGGIPAIALTGYASSTERQKLLSSGYQIHLSKPVDIQQLVKAIIRLARTEKQAITFS